MMKWVWIPIGLTTLGIGGAAVWFLFGGPSTSTLADADNVAQVALGRQVYVANCARCHGDQLQGEPNWMQRKPSGRLPAPPHDARGHTWHHPDGQLFGIVKNGITPYAPPGYQSDMPAFGGALSDDQVWAVLAYIKKSWPEDIRERQRLLTKQTEP